MLELILLKSMIGIMSVEWTTTVRDNESVSGSYNLYETVSNKTWMSAYISLKSVAYQWMHARCLKREVLKKCKFQYSELYTLLRGKTHVNLNIKDTKALVSSML